MADEFWQDEELLGAEREKPMPLQLLLSVETLVVFYMDN